MKRLGLLLDGFGAGDLAFSALYEGNKLDKNIDLCGFYIDITPLCGNPHFAIMEAAESMSFYGPIIATSIRTAKYLSTNSNHDDKFYYVWDLEWMDGKYTFEEYKSILTSMKIIARNEYVANYLKSVWGVTPEYIMDNFNLSEFVKNYDTTVRYTHATIN